MTNEYVGQASVYDASAMIVMGETVTDAFGALAELPENEQDADATEIGVHISRSKIVVVGNGHGMTPTILTEDHEAIARFLAKVRSGEYNLRRDSILREVPMRSVASLERMVCYAALSPKRPIPGQRTKGKRGIGLLATRVIGKATRIYTRPSPELAVAYWGPDILEKGIPTFLLIPATTDQLEHGDTTFRIIEVNEALLDLHGKPLQHGTRIEITDLNILNEDGSLPQSLRPRTVIEAFTRRWPIELREGKFTIYVEDAYTNERRPTKTKVPPPAFRGVPVFNGEMPMRGATGASVHAEIYYDPRQSNDPPLTLVREGTSGHPLATAVPTLRTEVPLLCERFLKGFVQAPPLDDSLLEFDSSKMILRERGAYNQFVRTLARIAEEVEREIHEIQERTRERQKQELSQDLSSAIQLAVRDLDELKEVQIGPAIIPEPPTPKGTDPKTKDLRTLAKVYDEHEQGLAGITLELLQGGQTIDTQTTKGKSGTVSFGILDPGKYNIRVIVPQGMTLLNQSAIYRFDIDAHRPNVTAVFVFQTGSPPPPARPRKGTIPRVQVSYLPFGNADEIFDATRFSTTGLIEINADETHFALASAAGDADTMAMLTAHAAATAVVDHVLSEEQDPTVRETMIHKLFATCYARAKQLRTVRSQEERSRRR